MNTRAPGRHFLQIPGPTDVPGRVLRAISEPTTDHRGPDFAALGRSVLTGLKRVFQTNDPVLIFPASGTGAWEAALVNTLSPGERSLCRKPVGSPRSGARWRSALASSRSFSKPTGDAAPTQPRSRKRCEPTREKKSARSGSSTTRPRPAASAPSPLSAEQSTRRAIRRCCSSTRSLPSLRLTTDIPSGASTSPSPEARRD